MPDLDLSSDEIALAIHGASERNSTLVLGYVADDGTPAISFRGSTQVHTASPSGLASATTGSSSPSPSGRTSR